MTRKQKIFLGVAIVGLLFFLGGPVVVTALKAGSVVGDKAPMDRNGGILTPPEQLLASANRDLRDAGRPSVTLDEYALARALRSEHGSEPESVRAWVGWAIKNSAGRRGVTIFDRLTKSRNPKYSGKFARQRTDARFAATMAAPRTSDIDVARRVIRGTVDPTRGATNFFSPAAQDALFARAQAGDPAVVGRIRRDGAAQRQKWISEGLQSRGTPPGVSPRKVEFFGRGKVA